MSRADRLNSRLAGELKRRGIISDARIEAAFRSVKRHHFLPDQPLTAAYSDQAVITRERAGVPISSSSQPAIMAIMLDQLRVGPGMRVLEIGAGTGYNAALLAHMVGAHGSVTSLDLDQDIVDEAAAHLSAAGVEDVQLVCADGAGGWPARAPYDRILLTVGSPEVLPAWVEQLAPDGLIVLPLGLAGGVQRSVAFRRTGDQLESLSVTPCGFMPLRGAIEAETPGDFAGVTVEPGVRLVLSRDAPMAADRVREWLDSPGPEFATGVEVSVSEAWGSLALWLSLREPNFCSLMSAGPAARDDLPRLMEGGGGRGGYGLCGENGMALLTRPEAGGDAVSVRLYGGQPALAERITQALAAWDSAARPCGGDVRITAVPAGTEVATRPGRLQVSKTHHTLLIDCD